MEQQNRGKTAILATIYGLIVNIALSLFKFVAGFLGSSSAMIADAVHSLSDSLTDLVVIFSYHYSIKPEDHDHKYGHGKAERCRVGNQSHQCG